MHNNWIKKMKKSYFKCETDKIIGEIFQPSFLNGVEEKQTISKYHSA